MTLATSGVVVVAAGSGSRLGRGEPKAFVPVAGATVLERALRGVFDAAEPAHVVVVAPPDRLGDARTIAERAGAAARRPVTVVAGGATRQASVAAGLAALPPEVGLVLVHDAARPLAPGALFDRVRDAVRRTGGGVVPALPVSDTVKRVASGGDVVETVDRSELVGVQTPQGFPRGALDDAYARADREYTDDAALFAAAGGAVVAVEGDPAAFKITTAADLRRAEAALGIRIRYRTGIGTDVHAYDDARPLWFGGIAWPDEPGLAGHSDGDALLHAVCDALLSAAGLGDIGSRFGTADPAVADAPSEAFVRRTVELVAGAGYEIVNVAVQVIGLRPKIGPRRSELEAHLGALLGAPVSVGATTTDGLGFTGRGEGVQVVATALLAATAG